VELFSYIPILGILLAILYLLQRALIGNISFLGAFGVYLYFLFFLPGIILHELAHLLTALILGVPAGQLALFPRKRDEEEKSSNNWILGSVMIAETDILRTGLIGFAPMFLGIVSMVLIVLFGFGIKETKDILGFQLTWQTAFFVYLLMAITNTMFLSKEDRSGVWILPGIFLIIYLAFKFFGLQFSLEILGFFTQVILILNFCIGITCLINFLFLIPLSLSRKIFTINGA
jgi:hypothetical protein